MDSNRFFWALVLIFTAFIFSPEHVPAQDVDFRFYPGEGTCVIHQKEIYDGVWRSDTSYSEMRVIVQKAAGVLTLYDSPDLKSIIFQDDVRFIEKDSHGLLKYRGKNSGCYLVVDLSNRALLYRECDCPDATKQGCQFKYLIYNYQKLNLTAWP